MFQSHARYNSCPLRTRIALVKSNVSKGFKLLRGCTRLLVQVECLSTSNFAVNDTSGWPSTFSVGTGHREVESRAAFLLLVVIPKEALHMHKVPEVMIRISCDFHGTISHPLNLARTLLHQRGWCDNFAGEGLARA